MRVNARLNSSRNILTLRNSLILFYLLELEQNVRKQASPVIQNNQSGEKAKEDSSLYEHYNFT